MVGVGKGATREKSLRGSCMKKQRKGGWQMDSVRRAWKNLLWLHCLLKAREHKDKCSSAFLP